MSFVLWFALFTTLCAVLYVLSIYASQSRFLGDSEGGAAVHEVF